VPGLTAGNEPTRHTEGVATEDVVRASVDAFNRRDVEGLLQTFTPDVELRPFAAKVTGAVYRGEDGVRRWMSELEDEWSEWRVELDDLRVSGDCVLTLGRIVARGRDTGVEATLPAGFVSRFRGERITRFESYGDPEDAIAAIERGA
jgi:ketosteroid isomerase-like protein